MYQLSINTDQELRHNDSNNVSLDHKNSYIFYNIR